MKIIKKILRKILPIKIILKLILIKNIKSFIFSYYYDFKRFVFSSTTLKPLSEKNFEAKICANYHSLEKGLSMDIKKEKFGTIRVQELLICLDIYLKNNFNTKSSQFSSSIKVLEKYFKYHESLNDKEIINLHSKFKALTENLTLNGNFGGGSKEIVKKNTHSTKKTFKEIADFRKSVRNFEDSKLNLESLKKAIQTASKTPTTCNRQPNKIYYINDKEKIKNILQLQNGTKGWTSKINNLLICTTNLEYFIGIRERNQAYIDGGMFCMSLVYALEDNDISNCTLNWSVEVEKDKALRKLINIPNSEIIIMMIAVGTTPEKYLVAHSQKRDVDEILFYL